MQWNVISHLGRGHISILYSNIYWKDVHFILNKENRWKRTFQTASIILSYLRKRDTCIKIRSDYLGMAMFFTSLSYSVLHAFIKCQCIIFTERKKPTEMSPRKPVSLYTKTWPSFATSSRYQLVERTQLTLRLTFRSPRRTEPTLVGIGETPPQGGPLRRCQGKGLPSQPPVSRTRKLPMKPNPTMSLKTNLSVPVIMFLE